MTRVRALTLEALGGTCELFAVDAPASGLAETAAWIASLHGRLTRFDRHSELSRLNAAADRWIDVSDELHALLAFALDAYADSGGLVHAGVLPALAAAGYRGTFAQVAWDDRPVPASGPLAPLPELLELRPGVARVRRGAAIDLGGLAKGWIADRAAERLGPSTLVSCGGDLSARGMGPTGEGWPVGFGDRTLLLVDAGAATSGTTCRRWGAARHHVIDPRTGAPASSDLAEVSVLAPSAAEGEVLAKTALLLGSAGAPAFLAGRATGWALH